MTDTTKPVFLVDAYADPVVVRIEGRASFQNSSGLKEFFSEMLRQGRSRFVVDFQLCTSMDSTFLGVLAGAAMAMRRLQPPGNLTIVRVGDRNMELIRNLGLHRLATLATGSHSRNPMGQAIPLSQENRTEIESARLMLEAHENLVATDAGNATKFQDVLAFLRNRLEKR